MAILFFVIDSGNLVGLGLVAFAPGYALVAALFPSRNEISWLERLVLSVGLSLGVVVLIGFVLNLTPLGIRLQPLMATIALFTTVVAFAGWLRRMHLPPETRLSATVHLRLPAWHRYSNLEKALSIAFAASVALAAGVVAYVVVTPRSMEQFTEFYILGPDGNASGYPTRLNISQPGTVIINLVNHERATFNYTVRIDLVGVRTAFDVTLGRNQTQELNRTTLTWLNITLESGQYFATPYTFVIEAVGSWQIQFRLYKNMVLSGHALLLPVSVG